MHAHPTLEAKIAFLRRPESYPEPTRAVEPVETHMSWVFLTEGHAYKLKKPIRFERLDYGTLAARRWSCHEEIRVNQRMAPSVYLGVVPLVLDQGQMRIGGEGEVIEWLVRMRRLPAGTQLDHALRAGAVDPDDLRRVAHVLAGFYLEAPREETSPLAWREHHERRICVTHRELADAVWGLDIDLVDSVHEDQLRFLRVVPGRLDDRVRAGFVVEGHGDLRPEHVCLGAEPLVIDSLEFDRTLRLADPVDELGFLAMECERLEAPWVRDVLLAVWREDSGDAPPDDLVHWYQSVRACTRAKLAVWHLRDHAVRDREKWPFVARRYLAIARRHADAAVARL